MRKRIFTLVFILLILLTACSGGYEIGSVRLIADDIEYEPYIYFVHGMSRMSSGWVSASGIPFGAWLEDNIRDMQMIPDAENLQVVVDGRYGQIGSQRYTPETHDGMLLLEIHPTSFTNGVADVSLPNEAGTYLLFVDVRWSGRSEAFTALRYVFKIVK